MKESVRSLEQLRMRRLERLPGREFVRVERGRSNAFGRLDDADAEHLLPEVVHGRARELADPR